MATFHINIEKLRELRRKAEGRRYLPLIEISDKSGVSRITISKYQRGAKLQTLDAESIAGLMSYFGCDLDDLVSIETGRK